MKARFLIIPLLLLAACQPVEMDQDKQKTVDEEKPLSGSGYTLTIKATKGDPQSKALDLSSDGNTLGTYWKNTEKVSVYREGTCIGTLDVTPDQGEKPQTATLSGKLKDGFTLAEGDVLTLLLPRETWSYTGQNSTLTGKGSIEDTYDYATATVTINELLGTEVTTTADARFQNQQSVYRFGFKEGANWVDIKFFTISAAKGKLAQTVTYQNDAWTSVWGGITVTPAAAPADHFYYVSLRNDATEQDTYSFLITGSDYALYTATKDVPAALLDAPGRFISAKEIAAAKTGFAPASGAVSQSDNVY